MINIIVKYKKNFVKEIIVSGHSDYAEYGKDIVCAGVSAISVGSLNAIYELLAQSQNILLMMATY